MIEYPCFFFSVIDATGKPEAGILDGSLRWLGSYDDCKRISYHNETMALNIKGETLYTGNPCLDIRVQMQWV